MTEREPRNRRATTGSSRDARSLKRLLGVREGLAIALGSIIGVGILRTPGIVAGYLGDPWMILGIWLVGAVVAGLGSLLFAEMAAAFPQAGGKYVYAREAYGPVAGFVTGWSQLAVVKAVSAAVKAVVIAEYLILLTGTGSVRILAVAVILVFAAVHMGGLKIGALFQNFTTFTKVAILIGIAATGLWAEEMRGFGPEVALSPETNWLLGLAISYQLVAFTCYGWEDAAKMAEEVKDPGRSMPRILLGGAALVGALYFLMMVSFLTALTPAEMAGSPLVAQEAIAQVFGETAGMIMIVAGLLIIVSTMNVNFLGMPRVAYALSRDQMAPRVFTQVSSLGTPVPALLFVTVIMLGLAVTGTFEMLIRFQMLVQISVDLMILLGFLRLRKLRPHLDRPFRVPAYPWLPLLTVALYALILGVIVGTQPELALGVGVILGSLIVAGVLTSRRIRTMTTRVVMGGETGGSD